MSSATNGHADQKAPRIPGSSEGSVFDWPPQAKTSVGGVSWGG